MNKKTIYILSLLLSAALAFLIIMTRPSVDNSWFLILFFVVYYMWVYMLVRAAGAFLHLAENKTKRAALVTASCITAVQILMTFNALRIVELVLISVALVATGWYISRAKS